MVGAGEHLSRVNQILEDEQLLAMILPVLRSDYRAVETYEYAPGPPLRCPIVSLVGTDDPVRGPDVHPASVERTRP
jgi:surfactin synthase thioesterase subunit